MWYCREGEFNCFGFVQEDERGVGQCRLCGRVHQLPIGADASADEGAHNQH